MRLGFGGGEVEERKGAFWAGGEELGVFAGEGGELGGWRRSGLSGGLGWRRRSGSWRGGSSGGRCRGSRSQSDTPGPIDRRSRE